MQTHKDIVYQMIKEKRLTPYYQKILNLSNAKISYEILARGENNGDIVSPLFFLEQAKQLNLLNEISKIIIEKSFQTFSNSKIEFSINITDDDLKSKTFISFLVDSTKKYSIETKQITIEILEDILIDDSLENNILIEKIKELRSLGFKIALDDFGTRNSNFDRFTFLEIDTVKFDKIFLKDLHEHEFKSLMLKNLISLVKTLNIKTVIEGIETKADLDFSKENQIDLAQGFYLGRPAKNIIS